VADPSAHFRHLALRGVLRSTKQMQPRVDRCREMGEAGVKIDREKLRVRRLVSQNRVRLGIGGPSVAIEEIAFQDRTG
jgi:hypothetical protein